MSKLAKVMSGQAQKGLKMYKSGGAVENSKKDIEVKGKGKEGSKREEAFDKTQLKKGGLAVKGFKPSGNAEAMYAGKKQENVVMKKGGKC